MWVGILTETSIYSVSLPVSLSLSFCLSLRCLFLLPSPSPLTLPFYIYSLPLSFVSPPLLFLHHFSSLACVAVEVDEVGEGDENEPGEATSTGYSWGGVRRLSLPFRLCYILCVCVCVCVYVCG